MARDGAPVMTGRGLWLGIAAFGSGSRPRVRGPGREVGIAIPRSGAGPRAGRARAPDGTREWAAKGEALLAYDNERLAPPTASRATVRQRRACLAISSQWH